MVVPSLALIVGMVVSPPGVVFALETNNLKHDGACLGTNPLHDGISSSALSVLQPCTAATSPLFGLLPSSRRSLDTIVQSIFLCSFDFILLTCVALALMPCPSSWFWGNSHEPRY